MSHELRTPLNSILGFAQILQLQSSDPSVKDAAKTISRAGHHLLDIISEILDISRIECGRLECFPEPLNLSTIVSQAVDLISHSASESGIAISVVSESIIPPVLGDRKRLIEVLLNLLSNAVKYNRHNGAIEIRTREDSPDICLIEVRDTGYGVGEGSDQWLFQAFERGPNIAAEGTGLGLALSWNFAKLMGGDLYLKESSEKGSTFVLKLRIANDHLDTNLLAKGIDSLSEILTQDTIEVLYMEDNSVNLRVMEAFFAKIPGFNFQSSIRADMGLSLIQSQRIDIVLLDMHLPDQMGLDVLLELKSNAKTSDIPVLVVSADESEILVQRAMQAGAFAYISKPIDFEVLVKDMRAALKQPVMTTRND
jgi:CheY-like chemotaxis protein